MEEFEQIWRLAGHAFIRRSLSIDGGHLTQRSTLLAVVDKG